MTGDFRTDKYGNPLSATGQHLTDSVSPGLYVAVIEKAQRERDDLAAEIERLRSALERIDAIAISKKAGSLVRMQRLARTALLKNET